MKEGDEWKAAFKTNRGLFEPLVMFFSLCNSPGTFQTFMDYIFQELWAKGYVVIYMNDILIFSISLEAHKEAVKKVLEILKKNKLCIKPDKYEFHQNQVEFCKDEILWPVLARLKGHYAIVTLGKARDRRLIAVETISSNGNKVQRRFILGVGQRTNQSYIHAC